MINQEIIIIIIVLLVVFMINSPNNRPILTPTPTPTIKQVFIPTTPSPDISYGDMPRSMSSGSSSGSSGGMSGGSSGGMSGGSSGGMSGGSSGGMSDDMSGGMSGGSYGGMPGGKNNLPPLTKIPESIKNILNDIGNKNPTELQLTNLVSEVQKAIPNPKLLVEEVKNAPKDENGKPQIEEEKLQLYMMMIMVFMATKGNIYKEEVGEDIAKSYGSMPSGSSSGSFGGSSGGFSGSSSSGSSGGFSGGSSSGFSGGMSDGSSRYRADGSTR